MKPRFFPPQSSASIVWDYSDFGLQFLKTAPGFKLRRSPPASVGEPWPMPQVYSTGSRLFKINFQTFQINTTGASCDTIRKAIERYRASFTIGAAQYFNDNMKHMVDFGLKDVTDPILEYETSRASNLTHLTIDIEENCTKYLDISSKESCKSITFPCLH